MSFARCLRIARAERNWSQEKLAEKLEVSRQTVTKWEMGDAFPEVRTLIRLAVTLEKSLDWLLEEELQKERQEAGKEEDSHHFQK